MQPISENEHQTAEAPLPKKTHPITDYALILEELDVPYTASLNYLSSAGRDENAHTEMYISIIISQLAENLYRLIPFFVKNNVPFRIPVNKKNAVNILSGNFGPEQIGRVITLYFKDEAAAFALVPRLNELTKEFVGPPVFDVRKVGYNTYGTLLNGKLPERPVVATGGAVKMPKVSQRFMVKEVLKFDVKGSVYRGLLVKGFLNVKSSILKQGRRFMWSDDHGRDMIYRLHWQNTIHNDLQGKVRVPKILAFYGENEDGFLAMEFVKGKQLNRVVDEIFAARHWKQLLLKERLRIIDLLVEVIGIVEKVHEIGYVHRDLSPANFLLTPRNEICMIDLELCYHVGRKEPETPFGLGTPGFMSPQQQELLTPTFAEDVYAIGAVMIVFFLNLSPAKFSPAFPEELKENLTFFVGDLLLSELIVQCLQEQPEKRPALSVVKAGVMEFRRRQLLVTDSKGGFHQVVPVPALQLRALTEAQYRALTLEKIDRPSVLLGAMHSSDLNSRIKNLIKTSKGGFSIAISGMLHLLAGDREHVCPDEIVEFLKERVAGGWEVLKPDLATLDAGFYEGSAGVALTLHHAIAAGLLTETDELKAYLLRCFTNTADSFGLMEGVAGQGLCLLQLLHRLDAGDLNNVLKGYVDLLKARQLPDGGWPVYLKGGNVKKAQPDLSLFKGIPGIVLFLLHYSRYSGDPEAMKAAEKGLDYLLKQAKQKQGQCVWPFPVHNGLVFSSLHAGVAGMALLYTTAFDILGAERYKTVAGATLMTLPENLVVSDFSFACGLAGIGYAYIEAARVFQCDRWRNRANWVAQVLVHSFHRKESDKGYWLTENDDRYDISLLTGFAGISLFIQEYCKMQKIFK